MERTAWTDERLDDLAGEVRELRTEMRGGFEALNGRIDTQGGRIDAQGTELRAEMRSGFEELGRRIDALQQTLLRVGGGMMVGLIGVIAAVLVRGV